ncbi:MAG TPA: sigma-70 family RNA polymerase sigma factor [Gemmatimonadaceae bacterium]|nr:sigma-70 family RNA polymerase sigma factor [Gemmatimonadaceae bacterium]
MNPPPGSPAYREENPARDYASLGNAELLHRIAGGDQRALGALYDRQVTLVHSLAVRLLGDADDAEDVVEETFWQVWRQASRYDASRGSVPTWLCSIARSRALDLLRSAKRRPERLASLTDDDDHDVAVASPNVSPLGAAEQSEQRVLVRSALNELPPEQRESIELAYFGGLSQSEIAERTGQPLGTIKTRVRLAMTKLRARLSVLREGAP